MSENLFHKYTITHRDLSPDNYERYRRLKNSCGATEVQGIVAREMEHQIGRFLNMERVIREIRDRDVPGDFIEFGVWQGFSLMWLARLRDKYGLGHKKIVGVDSFSGLPRTSGMWTKGSFSDTDVDSLRAFLHVHLTEEQSANISIIKSQFDAPGLPAELREETQGLSLVHVDCDLGSSCASVLSVIRPYLTGVQYLLFDDWGISDAEIPAAVREFFAGAPSIRPTVFSETDITRYYRVENWSDGGMESFFRSGIAEDIRPWGRFRAYPLEGASATKLISVSPGGVTSLQYHHRRDEFWIVLDDGLEVTVGDATWSPARGEEVWVPRGVPHRVRGVGEDQSRFVELWIGDSAEDDIVRVEDTYGRV